MENVPEAKDDSLDTSEDPREDVEDREEVDLCSRGETLLVRFSGAMFLPGCFRVRDMIYANVRMGELSH